jgi:hypothetical protein
MLPDIPLNASLDFPSSRRKQMESMKRKPKIPLKKTSFRPRKSGIVLTAVFLAAVAVGYFGERLADGKTDVLHREELLLLTAGVLERLESFLQPIAGKDKPLHLADFSPETKFARQILSEDVLKGFSDGRFCPDLAVTRGEGIAAFGRLFHLLCRRFLRQPEFREISPGYQDVPPAHWLEKPLGELAGIGSLIDFPGPVLQPDSFMTVSEARRLAGHLITYLSKEFLVIRLTETQLEILTKGTMSPLPMGEWKVAFGNDEPKAVPRDGLVPFPVSEPGGEGRENRRVVLLHPFFQPVELPCLEPDKQVLWFFLLRPQHQGTVRKLLPPSPAPRLVIRAGLPTASEPQRTDYVRTTLYSEKPRPVSPMAGADVASAVGKTEPAEGKNVD